MKRRLYKNWYQCKKKAFTKYQAKASTDEGKAAIEEQLQRIVDHCTVVRVIMHTQISKVMLRYAALNWRSEKVAATAAQLELVLLVAQSNTYDLDWSKLIRSEANGAADDPDAIQTIDLGREGNHHHHHTAAVEDAVALTTFLSRRTLGKSRDGFSEGRDH